MDAGEPSNNMAAYMWLLYVCVLTVGVPRSCNGITFSVLGSKENNGIHYFAYMNTSSQLLCGQFVAGKAVPVSIFRGIHVESADLIVKDGTLTSGYDNIHNLTTTGEGYSLSIPRPVGTDLRSFACTRTTRNDESSNDTVLFVFLHTVDLSTGTSSKQFCIFVGATNGIFFVGDDIRLLCMNGKAERVVLGNISYESSCIQETQSTWVSTIPNITAEANQTKLSCESTTNEDLCSSIELVYVFDDIWVNVVPTKEQASGSVSLSCVRFPSLIAIVKWSVTVSRGNISFLIDEGTNPQKRIRLRFDNATHGEVIVFCTITIGSKTSTDQALISYQNSMITVNNISITANTLPTVTYQDPMMSVKASPDNDSGTMTSDSMSFTPEARGAGSLPLAAILALVIAAVVVAVVVVVAVMWYVKHGRLKTSKHQDRGGTTPAVDDNLYHVGDDNNVHGLSEECEVATNIVYEPYTGGNSSELASEL